MFAKLKKFMILIPCMILGLFLCAHVKVEATELALASSTSVVIGEEENKENKYYFTNSTSWTLSVVDYDAFFEGDTLLKYRVIRYDGKATGWSDYVNFVDTSGKFNVDMAKLSFDETEDVSVRNSVVMGSTYFVDVKYYARFKFLGIIPVFTKDQEKDETIKIVYNDNSNSEVYIPKVTVTYASGQYAVNGKVVDENDTPVGIITEIRYFYAAEKLQTLDYNTFDVGYKESSNYGNLEFDYDYQVEETIDRIDGENYLYILVKSGNGYVTIKEIDNNTKGEEGTSDNEKTPVADSSDDTGLFDYEFGEFILLVLIIVLVVSCALIITQKIVDYKKRLY